MTETSKSLNPVLSKRNLKLGLQCEKLLWALLNNPDEGMETSVSTKMHFDEGSEVRELARKLEGNGDLIDNE